MIMGSLLFAIFSKSKEWGREEKTNCRTVEL
jgi:hypothetical protein